LAVATVAPTVKENLEALLAKGADSATLRLALATHCLNGGELDRAIEHLHVAVALDADYSAAWKSLGKALTQAGRPDEALAAYRKGIEVATRCGDMQALREMTVFARRLETPERPMGPAETS
jgi:Tfp pilus assembly protein PilF